MPHCLVIGVGPGLGLGCVRRFQKEGYDVSMIARHEGRLNSWKSEIENTYAYPCDISDLDNYRTCLNQIVSDKGIPDVVIYNVAKASFGDYLNIDASDFEKNYRINTTGLLVTAQTIAPQMVQRGSGSIVVTGNTGALRGSPNFVGWSPSKAGQRILSEALARDLGSKGIHVCYIVVDALIDMPFARRNRPQLPDDAYSKPDELAETIYNTSVQPKSAWSFYVELRQVNEKW